MPVVVRFVFGYEEGVFLEMTIKQLCSDVLSRELHLLVGLSTSEPDALYSRLWHYVTWFGFGFNSVQF
jgi:hypothetical protein